MLMEPSLQQVQKQALFECSPSSSSLRYSVIDVGSNQYFSFAKQTTFINDFLSHTICKPQTNSLVKVDLKVSQNQSENDFKVHHQNTRIASNKILEINILSEELQPDVLVFTEQGSKENTIQLF